MKIIYILLMMVSLSFCQDRLDQGDDVVPDTYYSGDKMIQVYDFGEEHHGHKSNFKLNFQIIGLIIVWGIIIKKLIKGEV